MSLSPDQCRAARALLDWSQGDLSSTSKVATKTLADFERGKRTPYDRTLADIRAALETAGIEFIPENGGGAGVRWRGRANAVDEGQTPDELTTENDG